MPATDPLTMWREALRAYIHYDEQQQQLHDASDVGSDGWMEWAERNLVLYRRAHDKARAALAALPEKGEVMARRRNFLREWPPAVSRAYRGGYRRVLVIDCPEDTSGSPE